jgi:NitT/TauT family transport system substrate-binding protein
MIQHSSSRRVFLGLMLHLPLLALSGCGSQSTQGTSAAGDASGKATTSTSAASSEAGAKPSDKPLRVAYNQWIGHSGIFLAKEKGYFKDAGLNVDFKQFSGPADGVPPLLAGQLDVALTTVDTPILLSRPGQAPLANVMLIDMSNGADGVVAGKGIKSMRDLKGKTVAATQGQVNEFLLRKALQANGMSESDVEIVNMDAETGGAAVLAGKVPAAVTWEPWLSKAGSAGGSVVFSSAQVPNLLLDVATVTQTTLDERPADVRAFVAAALKGNEEAARNPATAAKVAAKYFGTTESEALGMLKKVKLYNRAENAKLMKSEGAPGTLAKSSAEIARFFVEQKVMAEAPQQTDLFTTKYLPAATEAS